jgi:hypothetical protein
MTSRREFLKAGLIAATLLPSGARADSAAAVRSARASTVSLYKVLFDTRFPASVAFAGRAAARGFAVHAIAGDMTRFWYDDLYRRWRQEAAAIAGLTAHGALFCLERLAWEQRMRVVYRGEHRPMADGCMAHDFHGPLELIAAAAAATAETDWAAELADVVAVCPRARVPSDVAQSATARTAAAPQSERLYSWVIAPVPRA